MVWESSRINSPEPFEISKSGKKVNKKLIFKIFLKKSLHIRSNFSNFLVTKTIDRNKFWFSQNLGIFLGKFPFDSEFSPVYHEITETSPFRCRVWGGGQGVQGPVLRLLEFQVKDSGNILKAFEPIKSDQSLLKKLWVDFYIKMKSDRFFVPIWLTRSLLLRCLIYIPGLVVDSKDVKPVKYLFLWAYHEHSLL